VGVSLKAEKILKETEGESSENLMDVYTMLSNLMIEQGNYENALSYFE
jgi:hypothetical protein